MNYKVIERKDPRNPEHRARTVSSSTSPKSESRRLPHASAAPVPITRHDCLAVLSALQGTNHLCPAGR